ncbi:hypothetical protein GYH30_018088 [Glycine max]|nr:hypothetical protein GYH30_018088 [Glycine max]
MAVHGYVLQRKASYAFGHALDPNPNLLLDQGLPLGKHGVLNPLPNWSLIVNGNPNLKILVYVLVRGVGNLNGVVNFKKRGFLRIFGFALPIELEVDLIAEDDFPLADNDVGLTVEGVE